MTGIILDGNALAQHMETDLAVRVQKVKDKSNGKSPILATILVGDDPSSATYVRMKGNACKRVGLDSLRIVLPQTVTTDELLSEIDKCSAYTPVPGGVGPMTIATLIAQTVDPQKKTLNIIFQPTRLASQAVEYDH